jgi:hypothetical protein
MAPIVPCHPRFNWIGCPPSSKLPIPRGVAWNVQVTKSVGFIARHGLWTDEQRRQAAELERRIEKDNLHLVRLAWADPHGAARAKAVTPAVFINSLTTGYNINVATTTLDSANARIFASFTRGGGMGLDEMTGSPNLTIVPDPSTFRVLPWAPGVGWVLCDEYFTSGRTGSGTRTSACRACAVGRSRPSRSSPASPTIPSPTWT